MKKRSRAVKLALIFFMLAAAWIVFAPFLAESLIVERKLAKADVLLVLAGSSVYVERTQKAAEIYRQGIAPKILLTDDGEKTGWSRTEQKNIPYVEMARRNLIAQGVPAENIEICQPSGSGTIYEAQIIKEKMRANGWQSILIVTSAYHTRRALSVFERQLTEDNRKVGIVGVPTGQQTPSPFVWWLTPRGWSLVAGEYVKSFYYWLYY